MWVHVSTIVAYAGVLGVDVAELGWAGAGGCVHDGLGVGPPRKCAGRSLIPHPSRLGSCSPGFYLVIVFLTLGIACALFYLAELIEEYTSLTKRLLGHIIKVLWVCRVDC